MTESDMDIFRRRFAKDFPKGTDLSLNGCRAAMNKIVVDIAKEMLPHAASTLGIQIGSFRDRLTNVEMVETPEVNGFAKSSDGWRTFQIGINLGLMMFFHKMTKVFASVIGVMGEDGRPKESPTIPFTEVVAASRRLVKAFWEERLMHEQGFQLVQLSDSQITMASMLLHYAESFTVAHELGHIILNVSPQVRAELTAGTGIVRGILEDITGMNDGDKTRLVEKWGNEIASDLLGLQLAIEHAKDSHKKVLIYSSVELVFLMQEILEAYLEKVAGTKPISDTHPPSSFRLGSLRAAVRSGNPPQIFQIGEAFETLSEKIIEQI